MNTQSEITTFPLNLRSQASGGLQHKQEQQSNYFTEVFFYLHDRCLYTFICFHKYLLWKVTVSNISRWDTDEELKNDGESSQIQQSCLQSIKEWLPSGRGESVQALVCNQLLQAGHDVLLSVITVLTDVSLAALRVEHFTGPAWEEALLRIICSISMLGAFGCLCLWLYFPPKPSVLTRFVTSLMKEFKTADVLKGAWRQKKKKSKRGT